jgi:hypothetical protein
MYSCDYGFCSSRLIVDKDGGDISAIDIIEAMSFYSFPSIIPKLEIYFSVRKEREDPSIMDNASIKIKAGKEIIFRGPLDCNFGAYNRSRIITRLSGIPIPADENVVFELLHGEECIGKIVVDIKKNERESPVESRQVE